MIALICCIIAGAGAGVAAASNWILLRRYRRALAACNDEWFRGYRDGLHDLGELHGLGELPALLYLYQPPWRRQEPRR